MTTATPDTERQVSHFAGGGECDGCPRCKDSEAGFCKQRHPKWSNLHPVCRTCGHCVLRGTHRDNIDDLKEL